MVRFIILLGLLLSSANLFADELPQILSYPKTSFGVYRGDTVKMTVTAKGQESIKWMRVEDVLCRSATCEADTKGWSLGTHRVIVVVYNEAGSRTVVIYVNILAPPAGYRAGVVTPPSISGNDGVEARRSDDYAVAMTEGRGFSYQSKNVHVVGTVPRVLNGNEKLRTQEASWMRIRKSTSEEHFLGPQTTVHTLNDSKGRKVLELKGGRLRSRQVSNKKPNWIIFLDKKLRLSTNETGDVIVERLKDKEETFAVHVLRGEAKVSWNKELTLSAGTSVTFKKKDLEKLETHQFVIEELPTKLVASILKHTTPQFFKEFYDDFDKSEVLLLNKQKMDLKEAKKSTADALADSDYLKMLELMLPHGKEMQKDFEVHHMIGRAYFELGLNSLAYKAFTQSTTIDKNRPEPYFYRGMISLRLKNWREASNRLKLAENRDYQDSQALHYYQGVASYRIDRYHDARKHFQHVVWNGQNQFLIKSAQEYLKALQFLGWIHGYMSAGVFYDGNVLNASDLTQTPLLTDIEINKSVGSEVGFGLRAYGYHAREGEISIGFSLLRRDYFASALKPFAYISDVLDLTLHLQFGGKPEDDPYAGFRLKPFLQLQGIGGERALDSFGYEFALLSPMLKHIELYILSITSIDPLPAREDMFDTVIDEPVLPTDRSNSLKMTGIRFDLMKDAQTHWKFDFALQTVAYNNVAANPDDFRRYHLGLPVVLKSTEQTYFDINLSYDQRTFVKSDDARKDTIYVLGGGWKYLWTPVFHHHLGLDYQSQTSNRQGYGFKKPLLKLDLRYDF